jgi:hypothetical protein
MVYVHKPSTSDFDVIKTSTGANCVWCSYMHTAYAIVRGKKMERICGPCARGLLNMLPIVSEGDAR